jgi:hypothetical protein
MLYAVLVIKNKLYGCFMKKPYIFSCTAHATRNHSMDEKGLLRGMRRMAVVVVYIVGQNFLDDFDLSITMI